MSRKMILNGGIKTRGSLDLIYLPVSQESKNVWQTDNYKGILLKLGKSWMDVSYYDSVNEKRAKLAGLLGSSILQAKWESYLY